MIKKRDKKQVFQLALTSLREAIDEPINSNRDRAGVIQCFEFTYESSWKFLQTCLEQQGHQSPTSPRKAFELAFQSGLIQEEKKWLEMLKDRNLTTHTYDINLANEVINRIKSTYINLFNELEKDHAS